MALGACPLVRLERVTYAYPGLPGCASGSEPQARPALADLSLEIQPGEKIAVLGPSGGGKSTLLRALAGLVPHFHGGRFSGRVEVAGRDTRRARPSDLAGIVATVFQDPEDQIVMLRVANEVAFGLENVGTPPVRIWSTVQEALESVAAAHLIDRLTAELSGGELQRVCLASALALAPELLLLDEPTSQLDPASAESFLDELEQLAAAVVLTEHRTARALAFAERVLFVDAGRLLLDAPREDALAWLTSNRPAFVPGAGAADEVPAAGGGDLVLRASGVGFSYRPGVPVLADAGIAVARGEVVALEGPNGCGKTTFAKIAAGLLQPDEGAVKRDGRIGLLSQDPGRYVLRERVLDEVALAVGGDFDRARRALERVGLRWAEGRHPRDLSSGERERLGLAAVAVAEPDLLILDEPTRGIDPERKAELARWLFGYAAEGRAVLVVTHDAGFPVHRRVSLVHQESLIAS